MVSNRGRCGEGEEGEWRRCTYSVVDLEGITSLTLFVTGLRAMLYKPSEMCTRENEEEEEKR